MSRAREILEEVGAMTGATLSSPVRNHKHTKYLKCQSCGAIHTMPSGVLAPNSVREPQVQFAGENHRQNYRCPKCGGPLIEVHKSSAAVMGGQSGWAGGVPGGALQGGAFH